MGMQQIKRLGWEVCEIGKGKMCMAYCKNGNAHFLKKNRFACAMHFF